MITARNIADALSVSRVVLAFCFLWFSQLGLDYFWHSVWILLVAQLTDHADGYIARRYSVPTLTGYMLDSLGDKVFYIAVVIVFNAQGIFGMMLAWALVSREIVLYILRICNVEKTRKVKSIHIYSRLHGLFIRVSFGFAMISLFHIYKLMPDDTYQLWADITGWLAVTFGVWGIYKFMKLTD
ncbi:CDP-alcohol phosphatidyltransferase family protein [Pseudodesulfovibrio sp.]|uniref:CDP-alcohol phosphatidyltransferase family protein n=1 Tax=unclassified Pseudodesulfovibrio TaxID=2661612 RepID=UPI003B002BB5